jgi:ATP/ADP translocase
MLQSLINRIQNEYKTYSSVEKLFILCMMVCSFVITAEAAITRSVSNSCFIGMYSSKIFPYAWLASLPLNYYVVAFYNKFIQKFGCRKMMGVVILFTVGFNFYSAFYLKTTYFLPFFLYLWKDIFIMFMFHKLWSVIHSTIKGSKAKYIYGIFYGIGGMGSVCGSLVPSFFAVSFGTERLLLATVPLYLITYLAYSTALNVRDQIPNSQDLSMGIDTQSMKYGMVLIKNSKLLKFILFIVIAMQVSSAILENQWNILLKQNFPILDLRTQFMGRFFGVVNFINIFLQFFGSFILLRVLGLKATHAFIPSILLITVMMFFLFPNFFLICASFGMIKSLDYSIFGIVKEMLYIPLNVEQKFKAKAIIDVFAYRSSKAVASLLILGLGFVYGNNIASFLTFSVISIFILWIYSVFSMKETFEKIENGEQVIS